jgi:hypothetical protein
VLLPGFLLQLHGEYASPASYYCTIFPAGSCILADRACMNPDQPEPDYAVFVVNLAAYGRQCGYWSSAGLSVTRMGFVPSMSMM